MAQNKLVKQLIEENLRTQNPYLELGNCGLDGTEPELEMLAECTHLETLIFSNEWVVDYDEFEILTDYSTRVHCSQNSAEKNKLIQIPTSLPKSIKKLVLSGQLDYRWNIQDISFLKDLNQLKYLDLRYNQIHEISFLQELKNLNELNLSSNQIKDISLANFEELIEINILGNPVQSISLRNFSKIQYLDFSRLELINIELLNLSNLQSLDLNWNQIQDISLLKHLPKLKKINLSWNQIQDISFLKDLNQLEYLDLSYNQIICISLKDFNELIEIKISGNPLQSISFKNFSKIQKLNLSSLKLKNIELLNLYLLQELDLRWNQIQDTTTLYGLQNLITLDLSSNQIHDISLNFLNLLPKLENLILYNNPIQNIPKEIFDKEYENVLEEVCDYLTAQAQGQIINAEAKVIWFGNGEVGKTTLSHQFRENEFNEAVGKDRTHGVLINDWFISYQDVPKNLKTKIETSIQNAKKENPKVEIPIPKQIILKLWDFGGQEYYHATHHLFLSSNVLYLLVWEQKRNYQDEDKGIYPLEYWQDNIQNHAEKNIIIEIQNKVKGACSPNPAQLQYKVHHRTDNSKDIQKYEIDIEDLKEAIFNQLHHLEYLGSPFPKVYDDIRQALRGINEPYLFFENYAQLCRENDFTKDKIMQADSQIRTLTHFLHETGTIICYHYHKEDLGALKNYVFLRPQWVTDYIYKILSKDLQDKGEFDLAHIQEKTKDSGIEVAVWRALMKEFKLIFENKTTQNFIAPQYLPKECKEQKALNWALKANPELVFTLHFPKFLAKHLFLQFIVEYGTESIDDLYWKNGLVFSLYDKTVYATCDYANRKITIQVQDKDPKVTQELYQWFATHIKEDTEISVGGEFEVLSQIKNPKFRKVYENDFWFMFGLQKNTTFNQSNEITMKQINEILQAIDNYSLSEAFKMIDSLGINTPEYNRLKKTFIAGKDDVDFIDRLKIYVRSLSQTNVS